MPGCDLSLETYQRLVSVSSLQKLSTSWSWEAEVLFILDLHYLRLAPKIVQATLIQI